VVTDTACLPQTHRQDRLQYTVPLASAQCNKQAEEVHLQDETFVAKRIICDHGSYVGGIVQVDVACRQLLLAVNPIL